MYSVPLAQLSPGYSRRHRRGGGAGRAFLWIGALFLAAGLALGVTQFWHWKHPLASSGGLYFIHPVVIPVPAFQQNDPQWSFDLLGPTYDTLGQTGCAITSAAMVLASYGVDTDPKRLNHYLNTHGGYTPEGWVYWEKAAAVEPTGQVENVYEDLPTYGAIDRNLLAGNPVIIRLTTKRGTTHFVVIVGKQGWDYLIRDPARPTTDAIYPLKELTGTIEALRFYTVVPPKPTTDPRVVAGDLFLAKEAERTIAALSPPPAATGPDGAAEPTVPPLEVSGNGTPGL